MAASMLVFAAGPTHAATLTVLAASSLTESLQQVATTWEAETGHTVALTFDATSKLVRQVEGGVPADVLFSADAQWIDHLTANGQVVAGSRVNLLGNTLVAITAAGKEARTPDDLAGPSIARIGLAGEHVPAGRYGRAALTSLGVWDDVSERTVWGDSVRTVLNWVGTGEVDAGIVYLTDARVSTSVNVAFTFPPSSHPPIRVTAAVLTASPEAKLARAFLGHCRSKASMATFLAAGFTEPK